MTITHDLKCWPEHFQALKRGEKTAEIRKNDRDYQVGHILHMREYAPDYVDDPRTVEPVSWSYTGDELDLLVTHKLDGPAFGIAEEYCMMSVHRTDLTTIPRPVLNWLVHGDTGASSEVMCWALMGVNIVGWRWHPHDASDFGRCLGLLDSWPAWRSKVSELARLTRFWAALVPAWDELERLYRSGAAEECGRRMRDLLQPVYDAAAEGRADR